ncbi:lipid II flippase MurJ [Thiomonas sp.]|uniref:lipid II flippase MurJ n=1 Tax=Thiomonas sp. TaxID=2047785 RepID=UPI0026263509|nr:lipid II flippase MurJ [Thiomonas sp.]
MSLVRVFSFSLLLLAASRLLGLVRDMVVASQFGLSGHADAALVVLSFPDLAVSLLWGAAVPAVMVPRMAGSSPAHIASEGARWSRLAAVAFLLAGVAVWWQRDWLVHMLAPGLHGVDAWLAAQSLGWSALVALPAGAVAMVGGAMLQAQSRLQWQYAGQVVFNLCLIGGLVVAAQTQRFDWVTLAVAVAALARLGLMQRVSRARLPRPAAASGAFPDAESLRALLLALAASGLTVLYTLAARAIMSDSGAGQLGVFQYAQRMAELPLHTVFAVASALALARLSAAERRGDGVQAQAETRQWLRAMLWLSALIALAGMVAAPGIVRLLFGWGRMTPQAQTLVAEAMRWMLCLLPLQAAQLVLATRLNSHRRIADQVLGYGAGLLALAAAGALLPRGDWRGLAAYAAAWLAAVAVLWWRLARHQADAQRGNAAVLLAVLMGLAAAAAGLQALALAWPLALLLAAGLFAAGLWGLLRFDPLGRLVRDRYTSRLRRAA